MKPKFLVPVHHYLYEQGRIHGNTVADGWAGAVVQKLLAIQKYDEWKDEWTDQPTDIGSAWSALVH